jgi:hypothetical protein
MACKVRVRSGLDWSGLSTISANQRRSGSAFLGNVPVGTNLGITEQGFVLAFNWIGRAMLTAMNSAPAPAADHDLLTERHRAASRALARAVERDRDAQLTIAALTKALKDMGAECANLILENERLREQLSAAEKRTEPPQLRP